MKNPGSVMCVSREQFVKAYDEQLEDYCKLKMEFHIKEEFDFACYSHGVQYYDELKYFLYPAVNEAKNRACLHSDWQILRTKIIDLLSAVSLGKADEALIIPSFNEMFNLLRTKKKEIELVARRIDSIGCLLNSAHLNDIELVRMYDIWSEFLFKTDALFVRLQLLEEIITRSVSEFNQNLSRKHVSNVTGTLFDTAEIKDENIEDDEPMRCCIS